MQLTQRGDRPGGFEQRNIHQYKFRHYCRTVVILLGIVSEIENHCNLNNKEQASKIWQRLAEYNAADAKDIFEIRYKTISSVQLRDI